MLRPTDIPEGRLLGLAMAIVLLWLAAPVPPLGAQEAAPAEQEAEAAAESKGEEEEEDDELLEPSNTGYIDDAVIRSQVRLRYDSALDADRPDRAEFLYGKCSCFTAAAGQDSASPGPAEDLDFEELELGLEKAFGPRFSLFVEVPLRSLELRVPEGFDVLLGLPSRNVGNSGLGDVRVGMKYGLIARPERAVTFQVRGYFPTGEAGENLGTDHASIEPGLLHFRRLSDRWTVASELRWWHPLSGSSDPVTGGSSTSPVGRVETDGTDPVVRNDGFAGDVLRFGLGASYEARAARFTVSPVVELVGWYVVDGFTTPPAPRADRNDPPDFGFIERADNDTIVNLKLGARIRGGDHPGSLYVGYGFALTDDVWYDGIFRFEYRLGLPGRKRRQARQAAARGPAAEIVGQQEETGRQATGDETSP